MITTVKKLMERFMKKEFQKTSQKEFRIDKVIKGQGDRIYTKWKGYDNLFNSWINMKDIVQGG